MKDSSPVGSATDEETDEDSEPEPPQVIRRKVSFADAFGLNLVSFKEFDNPRVAESEVIRPLKNEATRSLAEFYLSCLFTVPSSPEELHQRLQKQMVELENIELLPGTSTLRGTVRVVNLCYSKSVCARISMDRWTNYFDLYADYLPGSSDWETDRFTFKYTLVPPFERGGTRVEICLRYETSVGTFWANNGDMNYVLFCHRRVKEHRPQVQEEIIGYKSKRSCLKTNRRGSAEEKTRETSKPSTSAADAEATLEAAGANGKNSTDVQSLLYQEEHKHLVRLIYHLLEEQTLLDVCVKNKTLTSPEVNTVCDNTAHNPCQSACLQLQI
ncbi:protein phosphatase 1 regulatory subunit 3A [Pseudoliparis swirei]|uniref:protein phosphatase 1 regulatory subunit 3A n=1 Tax=Pseudoliparis swirei TaxID=2059687 RepID=UPI0024BE3738|nr:protein phosphatase 1 regulatory subunit 3A [Pseudoliparis swirei]